MPLILGTTPNNNWQVICGLCDQAGWQTVTKHPETWFTAENAQIASDDRVLLLHSHPVEAIAHAIAERSEEHTSELQSRENLVCRLLLEKKKTKEEKKFI